MSLPILDSLDEEKTLALSALTNDFGIKVRKLYEKITPEGPRNPHSLTGLDAAVSVSDQITELKKPLSVKIADQRILPKPVADAFLTIMAYDIKQSVNEEKARKVRKPRGLGDGDFGTRGDGASR